nr:CPCC family cysteine-rich protein [Demequina phytophila]
MKWPWTRVGAVPRTHDFPCPCCGHRVLDEPGLYELCPVCFWEDDPDQLRWPWSSDGANGVSLLHAQRSYVEWGAVHPDYTDKVRAARPSEPLDPGWRPIDDRIDNFETAIDRTAAWPDDLAELYWWRDTFWRHSPHLGGG